MDRKLKSFLRKALLRAMENHVLKTLLVVGIVLGLVFEPGMIWAAVGVFLLIVALIDLWIKAPSFSYLMGWGLVSLPVLIPAIPLSYALH